MLALELLVRLVTLLAGLISLRVCLIALIASLVALLAGLIPLRVGRIALVARLIALNVGTIALNLDLVQIFLQLQDLSGRAEGVSLIKQLSYPRRAPQLAPRVPAMPSR
jgi:ABC-type branched-subunit amino acid transport system permease subunit